MESSSRLLSGNASKHRPGVNSMSNSGAGVITIRSKFSQKSGVEWRRTDYFMKMLSDSFLVLTVGSKRSEKLK